MRESLTGLIVELANVRTSSTTRTPSWHVIMQGCIMKTSLWQPTNKAQVNIASNWWTQYTSVRNISETLKESKAIILADTSNCGLKKLMSKRRWVRAWQTHSGAQDNLEPITTQNKIVSDAIICVCLHKRTSTSITMTCQSLPVHMTSPAMLQQWLRADLPANYGQ